MLQVLVSVLGGGGTRGQFSAHILPASCPLQDCLQATFQFLDLEWNLLYLCNTYHWSPVPVRKCGYSLGDAVSFHLSVCSSLCANADLPASPITQVLITRQQSNQSLCNHCEVFAKLKPPWQKPNPVSINVSLLICLLFLSICFDLVLTVCLRLHTTKGITVERFRNNYFNFIVKRK